MEYRKRLNPECSLRPPKGIKGTRQKVIVTHNPSEIDQAQELLVRFPNLGSDDVIIPGTANLSFNTELTSTVDANRTLVSNIGRAIIKKLAVKFEGNEIMSVDDFNVLACYQDLWKTKSEKRNAIHQGIISTDGCTENCIKLRINAGNKDATNAQDKAIADAYRNKFIIPLDFEMLDSAAPYYQGEHSFASPISRSISHLEFFWVSSLSHLPFQMHKRYIRQIRTRDPMISRRTLSPLDYRTVAAEATENLWYLCTVAGPNN